VLVVGVVHLARTGWKRWRERSAPSAEAPASKPASEP
jgi:hypothetical protein